MKELLNELFSYKTISRENAYGVMLRIAKGDFSNSLVASFLTVYNMRSITLDELAGFREALQEMCVPVNLSAYDPIDLCGTGGDGKNTFNISTLASFIVSGAGQAVVKHGNNGVSSICGSSNLLSHFGYEFSSDKDTLRRSLDAAGICYLHAPLFHPALKNIATVRKELGVKTFFNMLGPMINPASPKKQITGVFSLELARLYGYLYQNTDKKYQIIHSLDGYDEISLTSDFKIIHAGGESIISPGMLGFDQISPKAINGGNSIEKSADIFLKILAGKGTTEQNNVAISNAGLALYCGKELSSFPEGISIAKESLESGKALESFKKFLSPEKTFMHISHGNA
jgi:anthranilate phosphoribosyltransferase